MLAYAARLDVRRFVRIHRSRVVNTERIIELRAWFNGPGTHAGDCRADEAASRGLPCGGASQRHPSSIEPRLPDKLQEQLGKGF
jgi:hypothetical protein